MAMDFFGQQDRARRQTRTLVWLFVLAVNLGLALTWILATGQPWRGSHFYPGGFFATNTLIVLAFIVGGTLIQSWNLRDGGETVARMVGGRPVQPSSRDRRERQLLNVVDEMALAAGIASPRVYLLERETAINAFAAGYHPSQAVLTVTAGTLQRLTRDELQGVVGHEFSHILNGDMRLNLHLIGVLFGIQMIAGFGEMLMQLNVAGWSEGSADDARTERSASSALFVVGAVLYAIGYLGILFGRLIKSAVSRQREYLADASAIQFTRNPDGLGGALRKIGGLSRSTGLGSRIQHHNAEQLSHLFLGAARERMVRGWLATHPPLLQRLRRIYGRAVALVEAPVLADDAAPVDARLPDLLFTSAASVGLVTDTLADAAGANSLESKSHFVASKLAQSQAHLIALPPALRSATRESQTACALVYALLVEVDAGAADTKIPNVLAWLDQSQPGAARLTVMLGLLLAQLPKSVRLPLLDLAMPALHQLSQAQRVSLLENVQRLIAADQRITLAEFVVQIVLQQRLSSHADQLAPIRFWDLSALRAETGLLLSLIAQVAAAGSEAAQSRFMRVAASCPELKLGAADLLPTSAIHFASLDNALQRVQGLAPLQKPGLVKLWLSAAEAVVTNDKQARFSAASADLLHALCAAIDAPAPPSLRVMYNAFAWRDG